MMDTNRSAKDANWIAKGCEFKRSDANSNTRRNQTPQVLNQIYIHAFNNDLQNLEKCTFGTWTNKFMGFY